MHTSQQTAPGSISVGFSKVSEADTGFWDPRVSFFTRFPCRIAKYFEKIRKAKKLILGQVYRLSWPRGDEQARCVIHHSNGLNSMIRKRGISIWEHLLRPQNRVFCEGYFWPFLGQIRKEKNLQEWVFWAEIFRKYFSGHFTSFV